MHSSKYYIKQAQIETGIRSGSIADFLGMDRQAFYNKLNRDSMSFKDCMKILNLMGYDLKLVKIEN